MAEIGAYYITILPSMNSFTGAVNKQLSAAGKSGGNSWLQAFKASALGTALGSLAVKAGNALSQGLNRGIQRLDTISNFPKVMESLGYTSKEAADSINLIMEHLDGLPTATDDMVSLTQAIADSTGDLDLATRAALGFNDMLLANGASTEEVTNATSILNRVLGKQNATVNQWASLQSVMPAQLSMVAEEMLGAGHSSEELRDALNNGTVSWNDFLAAIVKLDEEGTDSVASFEEQARAMTGGIGTAIDNVQNRIAAGWAAILEAIGREDIANTIDTFSKGVRDGMKKIGEWITDFKERVANSNIGESLTRIFEGIKDAVSNFADAVKSHIPDVTQALVDFIDGALSWIADHGDAIAHTIEAIGAAILTYKALHQVGNIISDISIGVSALRAALTAGEILGPLEGIAAGCGRIMSFGGPLAGLASTVGGVCEGVASALTGVAIGPIAAIIAAIAAVAAVIKTLWDNNEQFRNAIMTIWGRVQETFASAASRIGGALSTVMSGVGQVLTSLSPLLDYAKQIWNFICDVMAPAIEVVIDTLAHQVEGIVTTVSGVIEAIVGFINGFLTGDWSQFNDGLKAIWDGTWELLTAPAHAVLDTISGIFDDTKAKWDEWKQGILTINENIRTGVLDTWKNIKSEFGNIVKESVDRAKQQWKDLTTNLQSWNSKIQQDFKAKWDEINTNLGNVLNSMKSAVSEKFKAIADTVSADMERAKEAGSHASSALEAAMAGDWKTALSETYSAYQSIASVIGEKIGAARDLVRDAGNAIGDILGFPGLGNTVAGVFDGIKRAIEDPIQTAKDFIGGIVRDIENLFSGINISIPSFSLPHIDVWWEDLAGIVSIPHLYVDWYAKGGVFDTASIIGIGEHGREAALPLNDTTYREIARGISSEMGGDGTPSVLVTGNTWVIREDADIDRIADAIARKTARERLAA